MYRLAVLCALHGMQVGSMGQFNTKYATDFNGMNERSFMEWIEEYVSVREDALAKADERLMRALHATGVQKDLFIGDASAIIKAV